MDMVRLAQFGKTHVFRYSPRRGTAGAAMKDAVPESVKKERGSALERVGEETAVDFIRANGGVTHTVLIEEFAEGYATGYTGNYIKVYIRLCDACGLDAWVRPGCFVQAKIVEPFRDGALAELAQVNNE